MKDATADHGEEFMHAALVTNPNDASAIVATKEVLELLSGAMGFGNKRAVDRET